MREGVRLTVIGVAIGLLLAGGFSAILAHILFGVQPFDPPVFGAITLLLVATGALACYGPGRRAARVDPMIALRAD
jgi:putative ABC transport system permease protein